MTVTKILTDPNREDVIKSTIPQSHTVWPMVATSANGGYDVQPELAAPPGTKNPMAITTDPKKYIQ